MFAVLFIPDFSLQAVLRFEPALQDAAVALVDGGRAPVVAQMTPRARQAGVEIGMPSTQALARCADCQFRHRQPPHEDRAQEILIECAYSFAAYIESTAPGVCTLDLRGLPQPEGPKGWEPRALQMIARLAEFDLHAQAGIASSPDLALQAAHAATPALQVDDPAAFWQRLPVQSLAAPPEVLSVLRRWGIFTVSEFLALGKDRIAERLGSEGLQFYETAAADTLRPLVLTSPAPVYEEQFEYEQEVETLEPLLFMIRRFIEQLARRVALAGKVVEELTLKLHLTSAADYTRSYRIPEPTTHIDVLFRIVHNHLETVRTESPIRALTIRVTPCAPGNLQFELFEGTVRDPNRFFETLGSLAALVGSDRVGTPFVKPTHKPDDFEIRPVTLQRDKTTAPKNQEPPRGLSLRRFRPPIKITVRLRNDQPESVQSPQISGPILSARGPWRISGDWWENLWSREEWDVQTPRGLYRLHREGDNWFAGATYD